MVVVGELCGCVSGGDGTNGDCGGDKQLFYRCMEENTPILEELISLRQKQAELLGYKNHAHYVLEERMAKNPENVAHFLTNLSEKLQPLWEDEKVVMLKFKKEEVLVTIMLSL